MGCVRRVGCKSASADDRAARVSPGTTRRGRREGREDLWRVSPGAGVQTTCSGSSRRTAFRWDRFGASRSTRPVWASPAFGVELSLGVIVVRRRRARGEVRASRRPSSERGRSALHPAAVDAGVGVRSRAVRSPTASAPPTSKTVMRRVSGKLLESVELFDRYVGAGVEPGYRSLAWRLTFRHSERTLRDRELDARRSDILRALAESSMSDNEPPESHAVAELDQFVRHLADELAAFRRRALTAEVEAQGDREPRGGRGRPRPVESGRDARAGERTAAEPAG